MTKSMTAYARVCFPSALGALVLEIHSVNRKGLELALHLPKEFLRFDIDMRKWLSSYLERGQVTVRLSFQVAAHSTPASSLYFAELKRVKLEWESACRELGLPSQEVDLSFLVSQVQPTLDLPSAQEETFKAVLHDATQAALKELMKMKQTEGTILAKDIVSRLSLIEENLALVELHKEIPLISYRRKMTERLQEVSLTLGKELEEKIAREVALLAEKADITEEIVRLRAHVKQMQEYLFSPQKSVGKTLDFLAQEMHREINTLGSKSQDSDISSAVIKMKSELDRIREQVQNIE